MAATGYAALDAGQTKAVDICQGAAPGCANTATMYRVAAGGQFSDMLGVEFSYAGRASLGSIGPASGDWKLTGFELSGIGTFPFGDVFALTAKLGVAQTTLKITGPNLGQSANSNTLAWGLGALFNINKGFAVRAQYEELCKVGDAAATGQTKVTPLFRVLRQAQGERTWSALPRIGISNSAALCRMPRSKPRYPCEMLDCRIRLRLALKLLRY